MNDERLIREYSVAQNQEAFAELARRYASLVYGTALRHVREPFVAEEICQKAFLALATGMGSIRKPSQLPAWLYQTTRRLAAMHIRSDQRRVARERIAASMIPNEPATDTSWEAIEPLLNEGLDKLGEKDRAALLLRFFRSMSMAEVAEGLGTSEAAAKMRVGRAVEKLRTFFSQHGIACSSAVLLLLLQNNASAQPPASVLSSMLNRIAHSGNASPIASKGFTGALRLRLAVSLILGLAVTVLVVVGPGRLWRNTKAVEISQTLVATPIPARVAVLDQNPVKTSPAPAALLRLTVLDEKTSTPLFGVRVTALNVGKPLGEAVTDLEGHCELPRPTSIDGDFYYKLRAQCQGYASMNVSWSRFQHDTPADIPNAYELKMPQGVRIGGLITDEEGNPVSGIQLKIQSYWTRGDSPPRTRPLLHDGSSEVTVTDNGGKWTFDRLPPLWENVRFSVSHRAFLPAEYACDATDLPRIGQVTISKVELLEMRARIVLRRGPRIVGRVLDQSQKPIPGVRVVQSFDWVHDYATSTTGNDGVYKILNAPTGMLTLSFQADHYSPQTVSFRIDDPTTIPDVSLAPGHVLRGRVMDAGGNPLEGVSVDASQSGKGHPEFQFRTTTDATGLFGWDGAPADPVNLTFQARGFQSTNTLVSVDRIEQTITLEHLDDSGSQVHGQVLDDQTSQPVAAFKFYIYNGQGDQVTPKEGTNGKFSAWLEGQSSPAKIEIQAEGYEPATSEPILTTNGDQTVVIRLRAATGFDGLILTPEGKPAVGAEVVLAADYKGAIIGRRKLLFREETLYRVTDKEGRFHFAPVKDAKLIIAVHQSGYGERDAQNVARDRGIRLQPWGRIEGTLRSSGKPVSEAKVCLEKRFWNPWTPAVTLYSDPFIVMTDGSGRFTFEDVPPGDHALGHLFSGGMFETRATLRVNPGETTQIDLGGSGHPVTGKIHTQKFETGFDFSHSSGELKIVRARPADLPNLARRKDFTSDAAYEQAAKLDGARRTAYWNSAEGLAAWRDALSYAVWFDEDGTFHADDVPTGEYDFNVSLKGPKQHGDPVGRSVGFLKAPSRRSRLRRIEIRRTGGSGNCRASGQMALKPTKAARLTGLENIPC